MASYSWLPPQSHLPRRLFGAMLCGRIAACPFIGPPSHSGRTHRKKAQTEGDWVYTSSGRARRNGNSVESLVVFFAADALRANGGKMRHGLIWFGGSCSGCYACFRRPVVNLGTAQALSGSWAARFRIPGPLWSRAMLGSKTHRVRLRASTRREPRSA